MKHIPRWVDWIVALVGLAVLGAIIVTLDGCGDSPRMPPSPEPFGPPAPATQPVDPLLPLLVWLAWISVAGMAASVAAGIFLKLFRDVAVQAFLACAGVLVLARTLGKALPWLPWVGMAAAALWLGWYLLNRFRKTATAAVSFGAEADRFISTYMPNHLIQRWEDQKHQVIAPEQELLGVRKHVKAIRDNLKPKQKGKA